MLRELLSLGDDAVGQRVGVLRLLAGPAALRAVRPGGGGLGSGFHAPHQGTDVNFLTAVRAFHVLEIKPNSCLCEPKFKVAHYQRLASKPELAAAIRAGLKRGWRWHDGDTLDLEIKPAYQVGETVEIVEPWCLSMGFDEDSVVEISAGHLPPVHYFADGPRPAKGRFRQARFMPSAFVRTRVKITGVTVDSYASLWIRCTATAPRPRRGRATRGFLDTPSPSHDALFFRPAPMAHRARARREKRVNAALLLTR